MTCTRENLYTPNADVAVPEGLEVFEIEGYGSGQLFSYGIPQECFDEGIADGKEYVKTEWADADTLEFTRQRMLARNAEIKRQVYSDGYFLYTSYDWENSTDDKRVMRAVCFDVEDVSDLYCWRASTFYSTNPDNVTTQDNVNFHQVQEENVQNYTDAQIEEQTIHGNVIKTDPATWTYSYPSVGWTRGARTINGAVAQKVLPLTSGSEASNFRFDNFVQNVRVRAYDSSKPKESRWSEPVSYQFSGAVTMVAGFALASVAALSF